MIQVTQLPTEITADCNVHLKWLSHCSVCGRTEIVHADSQKKLWPIVRDAHRGCFEKAAS